MEHDTDSAGPQKKQKREQKRLYLGLIMAGVSVLLCIILEIVAVALGISYATMDDEVTAMIIQGAATGGVIIISCVFTAAFHYTICWLNQIHDIEHTVEPVKRRSLKPLGTAVETKTAHMRYTRAQRPANHSQFGDDEVDIAIASSGDDIIGDIEDAVYLLDHVGEKLMKPFFTGNLRQMTTLLIVLLFLSSMSFLLGLMALIWGITIACSFGFGDENVIWPFITVEVIVGLVCPLLIYIGVLLFAIVLDYVTMGRIDVRTGVNSILPSVQLLKAEENEYWVIKSTFYYLIRKRPQNIHTSSCTTTWDFSRATIYFITIIGLLFILATSFFMNRTIVEQVYTRECRSDLHYDCFVREDEQWIYVDCNDTETLSQHSFIHCYTFLRFAIDSNPISNLAQTFAFYLATVAFFGQVFGIVKILLHLRPSRLWGIMFVLVGVIVIGVALFLIIFESSFSLHRNVIGSFQVLIVGLFLVIVGALLFEAGLWEGELLSSGKSVELRLFKPGHHRELDNVDNTTTDKLTTEIHTTAV